MAHMAKSELARQEVTNRQNWIRPWVDSKLSIKSRLDKVNSAWGLQRFGYISYVWNPYYGYVAKQTIYEYYIHTVCAVWTCTWSSRFEYLFVGKNVWVDRTRKCCHSSFGRSISSITTIWLYNIYHKWTIDSRYITISININYILINIIQFIWIETKKYIRMVWVCVWNIGSKMNYIVCDVLCKLFKKKSKCTPSKGAFEGRHRWQWCKRKRILDLYFSPARHSMYRHEHGHAEEQHFCVLIGASGIPVHWKERELVLMQFGLAFFK